jgi:hypothetical protein
MKNTDRALIQQSKILTMKPPERYDLKYIQNFIASKAMCPYSLKGTDAVIWGNYEEREEHADDLIALRPRQEVDMFSGWLAEHPISYLKRLKILKFRKPDPVLGMRAYRDASIYKTTFWVTSVLASLIPKISIVVLVALKSKKARIGTVGAFNLLISVCLTVFTDAKRADVFAISAA